MPHSTGRLSASASSHHSLSSVVFITNIAESDFRHAQGKTGHSTPKPDDSNQHPARLNVKTARSWRGIVAFTHLAREGRMTVIIGRRELLAALGGAAIAWPLASINVIEGGCHG